MTHKKVEFSTLEYDMSKGIGPDINVDNVLEEPITHLKDKCAHFLAVYRDMEKRNGKGFRLIIPSNHPWYKFLYHLFSKYHQSWDEKTHGDTIKYFYVERSTFQHSTKGTPCFFFVLEHLTTDYEENHLGYSSLTAKPRPISSVVKEACRFAVRSDIEIFRTQEIAKLKATGRYDATTVYHVHHSGKSFDEIFQEWAKQHGGIEYLYSQVLPTEQSGFETRFKDEALSESFREYHKKVATLVLLTAEEHHKEHERR